MLLLWQAVEDVQEKEMLQKMSRRGITLSGEDKLIVQVSFAIKAPKGTVITKKALNGLLDLVVAGKPLPRNVKVRGIFWRNPERRGTLSYWRYHSGADLSVAPTPIESTPRGSLREAVDTLAPFLADAYLSFR